MARILLIDDEAAVRSTFRRILEHAGHEVIEAGDGASGVRLYREQGADLVITDIFMPDQDGLETLVELRSESPALKIIVISGGGRSGTADFREEAALFGADRTLWKPVTMAQLLETVDELLRDEAGEPPPAS